MSDPSENDPVETAPETGASTSGATKKRSASKSPKKPAKKKAAKKKASKKKKPAKKKAAKKKAGKSSGKAASRSSSEASEASEAPEAGATPKASRTPEPAATEATAKTSRSPTAAPPPASSDASAEAPDAEEADGGAASPPPPAAEAPEPPPPPGPGRPPPVTATWGIVSDTLHAHYPPGLRPDTVRYYLSEQWRRNLEARAAAEAGARFAEDLAEAIEAATGLDTWVRVQLVDRPSWLLRVLLHQGRRFPAVLDDDALDKLGGEARLLDLWISALGPFYYAKGYRLWTELRQGLDGRPPPLDRKDRVARAAMGAAAKRLRDFGFSRVPGEVARRKLDGLHAPGLLAAEAPTAFDLLFDGALVSEPPPASPRGSRGAAESRSPSPKEGRGVRLDAADRAQLEVDVEMEMFQQELEDELEQIKDEIERARRSRDP